MITSQRCITCPSQHHETYRCSKCNGIVGHTNPNNIDWLYCPFCGEPLYPPGLNREQRIKLTNELYRLF